MVPTEADPFGASKKPIMAAAPAPAMALSSQPREVAEDVQRQAQLRRVDKDIEHLMRARYPLIYILSSEEKRVEKSIADVLHSREREKSYKTKIYTWSVTEGVRVGSEPQGDSKDPLKALRFVLEAKKDERAVFILRDLHAFQKNPEVVRLLRDLARNLKETLKTVFMISPLLQIPPELDKEVAVVEYPLPELAEIGTILDRVMSMVPNKTPPTGQEREHVIEAALGLTADEAENVFAKSLVQTGTFDIDVILSEKERIVRRSGVLEFFRTQERMDNIGGLDVEENLTIARTLLRLIGKPETLLSYVKDRPGHDRRYALHCDKMEKDLGWKPVVPLEEGLRQTIDWYKANGKWMAGVRGGEYLSYYEKYYENRDSSLHALSSAGPKLPR